MIPPCIPRVSSYEIDFKYYGQRKYYSYGMTMNFERPVEVMGIEHEQNMSRDSVGRREPASLLEPQIAGFRLLYVVYPEYLWSLDRQ